MDIITGKRHLRFMRERVENLTPAFFTFSVCLALLIGWRLKSLELITPSHGTGKAFGILGMSVMIVLFIYSLRKRFYALEIIGTVKMWFCIHMILGIIGPVFVLYHANFRLGAFNSNVALFSMLVVAISGIIGRYIYTRIHYSLYGQLANLIELQNNFEQQKELAQPHFELIPGVKEELLYFTKDLFVPSTTLFGSIKRFLTTEWKFQTTRWKIQRISAIYINQYAIKHEWGFFRKQRMKMQVRRKANIFLKQAVKVAEFNFYERIFSFWHILHIPLVSILIFTVIMHLIAINRY